MSRTGLEMEIVCDKAVMSEQNMIKMTDSWDRDGLGRVFELFKLSEGMCDEWARKKRAELGRQGPPLGGWRKQIYIGQGFPWVLERIKKYGAVLPLGGG